MRLAYTGLRAGIIGLLVLTAPVEVQAQGFLENLFGGFSTPKPPPVIMPPYGHRTPVFVPERREPDRDRAEPGTTSGRFRTICVRMCDGYYWPISHAVPRSRFYRDANLCKASCGEEARLFFHPSSEPDTNDMVDLSGRAYAKLASAYLYRKRQVDGCKCKPDPWAESELQRHRRYAEEEQAARERVAARPEPEAASPAAATLGNGKGMIKAPVRAPAINPTTETAAAVTGETTTLPALVETAETPKAQPVAATPRTRPDASVRRASAEAVRSGAPRGRPAPQPAPKVAAKPPLGGTVPFGLGAAKSRWPGD